MSRVLACGLAIVTLLLWPAPSKAQSAPAAGLEDTQPEQVPPAKLPAFIPPVTDESRKAAFPNVTVSPIHDDTTHSFVLFDQLEGQAGEGGGLRWETKGWIGRDLDRFWFRTEGDGDAGRVGGADAHALYGRAIARWWELVAGVRQDVRPGPAQTWAAVGIQGLAPYWFDIEATGYVGAHGRTEARFEAEYELRITNRLIVQPRLEVEVYGKADPERSVGAGLSTADAGLRLRYEFRRELAPYVGVTWSQKYFGTADFAKASGDRTGNARLAVGLRFWL